MCIRDSNRSDHDSRSILLHWHMLSCDGIPVQFQQCQCSVNIFFLRQYPNQRKIQHTLYTKSSPSILTPNSIFWRISCKTYKRYFFIRFSNKILGYLFDSDCIHCHSDNRRKNNQHNWRHFLFGDMFICNHYYCKSQGNDQ